MEFLKSVYQTITVNSDKYNISFAFQFMIVNIILAIVINRTTHRHSRTDISLRHFPKHVAFKIE